MDSVEEILETEYWNNTVQEYLIALGLVMAGLLIIRILRKFLLRKAKNWVSKSETRLDDLAIEGVQRFVLPILSYLFVYWGITSLELSEKVEHVVEVATSIVIAFFIIRFISTGIRIILTSYIRKQENGEVKVKQITGLMIIINIVIWVLGLLFLT